MTDKIFKLKYVYAMHLVLLIIGIAFVYANPFKLHTFGSLALFYGVSGGGMSCFAAAIYILHTLPLKLVQKFTDEDMATFCLISVQLVAMCALFSKCYFVFESK
jgi:hypothetical protein